MSSSGRQSCADKGPAALLAPSAEEPAVGEHYPSAEWVEGDLAALARMSKGKFTAPTLTDFHRKAIHVLQRGMGTGIYNVPANWKTAEFHPRFLRVVVRCHGWASFDFGELTRLIIAAHDECVRVQLEPVSHNYMAVFLTPRQREATNMASRHPTIEQAVDDYRGVTRKAAELAKAEGC